MRRSRTLSSTSSTSSTRLSPLPSQEEEEKSDRELSGAPTPSVNLQSFINDTENCVSNDYKAILELSKITEAEKEKFKTKLSKCNEIIVRNPTILEREFTDTDDRDKVKEFITKRITRPRERVNKEASEDGVSESFDTLFGKVKSEMDSIKGSKKEQYAFLYAILKMSSNKSEYQSTSGLITLKKEFKRDRRLLTDFLKFLKEGYQATGEGDKDQIEILTGLFKSFDIVYDKRNNLNIIIKKIIDGLTSLVKDNLDKLMSKTKVIVISGYSNLIGSPVRNQLYNFIVVEYFFGNSKANSVFDEINKANVSPASASVDYSNLITNTNNYFQNMTIFKGVEKLSMQQFNNLFKQLKDKLTKDKTLIAQEGGTQKRISTLFLAFFKGDNSGDDFSEWFYKNYRNKKFYSFASKDHITLSETVIGNKNDFVNDLFQEHMFAIAYLFNYGLNDVEPDDNQVLETLNTTISSAIEAVPSPPPTPPPPLSSATPRSGMRSLSPRSLLSARPWAGGRVSAGGKYIRKKKKTNKIPRKMKHITKIFRKRQYNTRKHLKKHSKKTFKKHSKKNKAKKKTKKRSRKIYKISRNSKRRSHK